MKYLTTRKLTSILKWGAYCSKSENYKYTKYDANLFADIIAEIKDIGHQRYLETKNKKYVKTN